MSEDEDLCSEGVPFDLASIGFEERLLTRRCTGEGQQPVYLDARRLTLLIVLAQVIAAGQKRRYIFLGNKYGHRWVEPRTEGYGGSTLDLELVDDAFVPFRRPEHLYLGAYKPDGMRL